MGRRPLLTSVAPVRGTVASAAERDVLLARGRPRAATGPGPAGSAASTGGRASSSSKPACWPRVAGTVDPQPVLAVVHMPACAMDDIRDRGPQLVVVCVDVRDPGNAGTIVRSAWAAGADAVVCCEGTVDLWNPKAVRSSAGAVLHVPGRGGRAPAATLDELGQWGLRRWGAVSRPEVRTTPSPT